MAGRRRGGNGPEPVTLDPYDRARVAAAVDAAEDACGLQIAVYVGPVRDDPGRDAERLLAESGALTRPAVLVLLAPVEHRVEVRTSPEARTRVPDTAAADAVTVMTSRFREGDLAGGLVEGVRRIAELAGPPPPDHLPGPELPDLLG